MLNKLILGLLILMAGQTVWAASSGIPVGTVISQIANLGLLIALIYFSQRKNIAQAFADRKKSYLASVEETKLSKRMAEEKLAEVTKRVSDMETTFTQQIEEAKLNAEQSYQAQLIEANNEATRLKGLAKSSLESEVQREVENLRVETFKKSKGLAEEKLEKSMSPEQLSAWTQHFTSAPQGVQ